MNRLVLHPEKTKFILFTRSREREEVVLYCDNNNLDQNVAEYSSVMGSISKNDKIP